jgi:threonine dehydratase
MEQLKKMDLGMGRPSIEEVLQAAERIRPFAHCTPVFTCKSLNKRTQADLYLKAENLQKVGAFKFRGACNAVISLLPEKAERGVATHSSGNHAQALALAARLRGITAYIVMPRNAPKVKVDGVAGYGGRITFCEPTLEAREEKLEEVVLRTGATVVHPYNDSRVIAGQGTAALELIEQVPNLDVVMTPVGGGGLLSGTAIAFSALSPRTRIIAAEPEGADDACRSLLAGRILPSLHPQTIADGLLTSLGTLTFPIIQKHVERIVTVSEEAILAAMRFIWERTKLIIEPSAAVPLAVFWEDKIDLKGLRIAVILSGGNVNLDQLPWQADRGT